MKSNDSDIYKAEVYISCDWGGDWAARRARNASAENLCLAGYLVDTWTEAYEIDSYPVGCVAHFLLAYRGWQSRVSPTVPVYQRVRPNNSEPHTKIAALEEQINELVDAIRHCFYWDFDLEGVERLKVVLKKYGHDIE